MKLRLALFFGIYLSSVCSWAYYSTHDTGDILPPETYNIGLSQLIATDPGTFGYASGFVEASLDDSNQIRGTFGTGHSEFHFSAAYKWVPVPDISQQPAIGGIVKAQFARPDGEAEMSLSLGPIMSKKLNPDFGPVNTYISLPLSLRSFDGDFDLLAHLVVGAEYKPKLLEHIRWSAELGLKVSEESFTYISVAAILDFNESDGVQFK